MMEEKMSKQTSKQNPEIKPNSQRRKERRPNRIRARASVPVCSPGPGELVDLWAKAGPWLGPPALVGSGKACQCWDRGWGPSSSPRGNIRQAKCLAGGRPVSGGRAGLSQLAQPGWCRVSAVWPGAGEPDAPPCPLKSPFLGILVLGGAFKKVRGFQRLLSFPSATPPCLPWARDRGALQEAWRRALQARPADVPLASPLISPQVHR